RQVAVLLHAAFRRRLATTPLRFANTSPPSGCVGDLHPQAVEHARHTTRPLRGGKDPGLLHSPSATATHPTDCAFAPCLYRRAVPCYPPAWRRWVTISISSLTPRRAGPR